ncbi:hypothetical protein M3I54_09265 [Paraburkholderia sp. CNPSo 3274]|uniref:hypothetical protein n=1 Tax=Paraburkholderia sp. CNPSo 3274 TaxID=2940932 RepID=UPI0020B8AED0|nr:hypothetical protein [Paraburkholderia sp. CNPSo 3274]MCP3707170.1 hypothetical protein [Paraburkholderia sp. CNPSo 3274]
MSRLQCVMEGKPATLHVFAQEVAWHWGISVLRERGGGFQVIAYNERDFATESAAMADGSLALKRIATMPAAESGDTIGTPFPSVAEERRRYMRERVRCAMARLAACDETNAVQAARWAIAWSALIGEQDFDKTLWNRRKGTSPVV